MMLGPNTSLIDVSYDMNAEMRNTRPITKEATPSVKRCAKSFQGAVFQLCLENAKLNIPIVMVTALRQMGYSINAASRSSDELGSMDCINIMRIGIGMMAMKKPVKNRIIVTPP